jgi:hypothetical protein
VSRCIQPDVADSCLHGRLSEDEFTEALSHAAGCADCRRLLFATSQPDTELGPGAMEEIQERLTTWRAARRAPMMPAFPWPKGHEVDRYVIIRSVGGTEDGVIYEAFDPEREDRVVVKQLDLHIEDPATPAFLSIARRLCQFSHPNVLQMLSVGVHDGFVYVVYEFVKGTPLSQASAEDPQQLVGLFAEAGRGLAAAHEAGIVHGSFSPDSCVVGRDGRVRVLDFGIGEARVHRVAAIKTVHDAEWIASGADVNSEDSFIGFVATGRPTGQFESIILAAGPNALGPRRYAAPELVMGTPPTAAADQFAFCAALYHRLYGHRATGGETIALWLRELLKGRIAPPQGRADLPASVPAALSRGLSRQPAARWGGMASLVAKLQRQQPVLGNRRRGIAVIAIGATVAMAGVVAAELRGRSAGAHDLGNCDDTLANWNSLWSTSLEDELQKASSAAAALPALRAHIDGWVGSWKKATRGFCRLPDDRTLPDCMSRAHAAGGDLLQLVANGSPDRLTRASAAVEALPTFEQCASAAPSPASAPLAAIKADVRRRLGMLDEADAITAKPPEDPGQRSYQSLVRGHTALDRGDLIEARRLFENASFEAQSAHLPELAQAAVVRRLALSCSPAERTLWSGYLNAQAPLGTPQLGNRTLTEYRGALAQSLLCEGKIADAVKLSQQVAQEFSGDQTATGGAAALSLARVELAQRDFANAEVAAHKAAAIYEQIWGPHHPLAQTARLTVAEAQLASPASIAAAAETIEHSLANQGDGKEPDAVRAYALLLESRLANARGKRDQALRLVLRASQEYEAALGGAHPDLANALLVAGDLFLASERNPEAEASYRQVAAILDTLGQNDSAHLAHARAGLQLARWGAHPPPDASDTLHWGLAPTGGAIDPAVAGWLAEQLGQRAAARGDKAAALAQYRAAADAWRQSGDQRGLASALTESALLAAELHASDARTLLEHALEIGTGAPGADKPRMQGALAKLLWPAQRARARALAREALADLPDSSADAADLRRWLSSHGAGR